MTRNERIAELIRENWGPGDSPDCIASAFEGGAFTEELGPEVTEGVMRDMRKAGVSSRAFWRYARTYVRYAMADARRGNPWGTPERWAECWQRFRRIAKFLRALEKSVK